MQIQEHVSLANYSTMRLGGPARYFVTVENEDQLIQALDFAKQKDITTHILGGGSNSIFQDPGFLGLVIALQIKGVKTKSTEESLEITAGAGEVWDDIVALSVEEGYFDIAALSLIPGSVGAAPIQNIGAYGQQISDVVHAVRAYDTQQGEFVEIMQSSCNFTYRHSRFNTTDAKRFIITSVKLRLHRKTISPPFYADIEKYFADNAIDTTAITPKQLREAVSAVRVRKLPDPAKVANTGSFFKNPVISKEAFEVLEKHHPSIHEPREGWSQLPFWNQADGTVKIAAGWLIEKCGFKAYSDQETGMATWKNQSLVLVNEAAKNTQDLLDFKEKIITAVQAKFGITLQQEPELVTEK